MSDAQRVGQVGRDKILSLLSDESPPSSPVRARRQTAAMGHASELAVFKPEA